MVENHKEKARKWLLGVMTVVTSSGDGMGCNLIRKLVSFEGFGCVLFLNFMFLDNEEINLWLPTSYSKALWTFWMCWSCPPKIKKKLFFVFLFLVFLQDKTGEGIVSIILGRSPIHEYKVNTPKNKIRSF